LNCPPPVAPNVEAKLNDLSAVWASASVTLIVKLYVVGLVDEPPKSVVAKTPAEDKVTLAPDKLDPTSLNVTALSEEAERVAIVPEKLPAKEPKLPALVDHVGASDTVKILALDITALPVPFSTLILYWASTDKVIVTVNDVLLLYTIVVAGYQIPVEVFINSTCEPTSKLDPVTVIVDAELPIVFGEIELIVGLEPPAAILASTLASV